MEQRPSEVNLSILNEKSDSSKDNPEREELLWDSKIEQQILKWKGEMERASKLHLACGRKYKKLYTMFALPNIVIPLVLSALMRSMKEDDLMVSLLLIVSGIFSGVSHLFGFSKRSTRHFEVSGQLDKLAKEIDLELSKPKRMRISADVYLANCYNHMTSITDTAPDARSVKLKNRRLNTSP